MKKTLALSVAAGALCSVAAAQPAGRTLTPINEAPEVRYINLDGTPYTPPAYGERAVATVWNSGFPSTSAYLNGAARMIIVDANFNPGPWATSTNNVQKTFALVSYGQNYPPAGSPPSTPVYRFYCQYFNAATDYVTAGNIVGGTPGAYTINGNASVAGTTWYVALPSHGYVQYFINLGTGITLPDSDIAILQYKTDTTGTALLGGTLNQFVLSHATAMIGSVAPIGTPNTSSDDNQDGGLDNATEAWDGDIGGLQHTIAFRIDGDVIPVPPGSPIDLGTLTDGKTSVSATINAGQVTWYKFAIAGDASRAANQYLGIITKDDLTGSLITDTKMAIYDAATGNLVGNEDDDDGAFNFSQLSYGIRADVYPDGTAPDSSRDFDGRDGELFTGAYYLGLAEYPAQFGSAYAVAGVTGTNTGTVELSFVTNVNGTPLSTVPAPQPWVTISPLNSTNGGNADIAMAALDTVWFKLEFCGTEADVGGHWMDIDFGETNPITNADAYLFDNTGNLITGDNALGSNGQPLYSFETSNSSPRTWFDAAVNFTGQNGPLAGGIYWLGVTHNGATTGTNWNVHSSNTITNIPFNVDFYTDLTTLQGPANPCCSGDFTGDGNADGDDTAALVQAISSGDYSNITQDPDFNRDGNVDGDDIAALVNANAGGGCP